MEGNARFIAKQDVPDFPFGALKQKESREIRLSTIFDLRDGLISRIRVNPIAV
jgi:hypothetical protein